MQSADWVSAEFACASYRQLKLASLGQVPGTCSHECAATSGADLCCADLHATITLFAFVKLTSIVTRMLMRTTSLHF